MKIRCPGNHTLPPGVYLTDEPSQGLKCHAGDQSVWLATGVADETLWSPTGPDVQAPQTVEYKTNGDHRD